MSELSQTSFELRRTPTQARAKATFKHILDTTAILLEEVGFDAFTTNLLSERAQLGVRAIYRYFPNKHALVVELARQMAESWRLQLEDSRTGTEDTDSWLDLWCQYLDAFLNAVQNTPGGVAVLQAMRSHPELRVVDDESNQVYMRDVALELVRRQPKLTKADANAISQVLLRSTVAVVDALLIAKPQEAKRMFAMLKSMHVAFLGQWFKSKETSGKLSSA